MPKYWKVKNFFGYRFVVIFLVLMALSGLRNQNEMLSSL